MRRDESPYFTENGTMFPAHPVNILFDVVTLREIFSDGWAGINVERKKRAGRYQLTCVISQYAWAVCGSGLLQSIPQVEIGAVMPLGVGGREIE